MEDFWLIVTTKEWKMRQTSGTRKSHGEKVVKDIRRAYRCPAVVCKANDERGANSILPKRRSGSCWTA